MKNTEKKNGGHDSVHPHLFREAMSAIPAAVHILATRGAMGDAGITATAIAPVTDTPPTILTCINRQARAHDIIRANGSFSINTLTTKQQIIAETFAGHKGIDDMQERFNIGDWDTLKTGAPCLIDAAVVLDCRLQDITEIGTHSVFFAIISDMRIATGEKTLTYVNRSYQK